MIKTDVGIIAVLMTLPIDRVAGIVYFLCGIAIYNLILKIKIWLFQT